MKNYAYSVLQDFFSATLASLGNGISMVKLPQERRFSVELLFVSLLVLETFLGGRGGGVQLISFT